jgi:hypothetical protein
MLSTWCVISSPQRAQDFPMLATLQQLEKGVELNSLAQRV